MSVAKVMSRCPFCKEAIASGATRCKHCHAELSGETKSKRSLLAKFDRFRFGFFSGLGLGFIIMLTIYLRFLSGD